MSIKFYQKLMKYLPNRLKYIAAIDVIAYASCGKYGSTNVSELSATDALKRFGDDKKVDG